MEEYIYSGVVQAAFPAMGFAIVNTAGPYTAIDKTVICRLKCPGGIVGAGLLQAPTAGTMVQFKCQPGTDKYYIVASNPQGTQPRGVAQELRLHSEPSAPPTSFWGFIKNIFQFIQKTNKYKEKSTANIGLQDQYEGDLYLGDRYGPGLFAGRAQLTVKGSQTSYIQMSSPEDKINVVTVNAQLDSLSDKISISSTLNKYLKASGILQGLGGRAWNKDKYPLKIQNPQKPSTLYFSKDAKEPIFRTQTFQGGAARGTYKSIVRPDEKDQTPFVISQMDSYDGTGLKFYAQGNCSIKTSSIPGLIDNPLNLPRTSLQGQEVLSSRKEASYAEMGMLQKAKLSQNGLQRSLQLDQIIRDDYTKSLLAGMLGYDALQLIDAQADPFTASLKSCLSWEGDQQNVYVTNEIGDGPTASDKETYTGRSVTRYLNSSFITQDPDGSITLKDGWGSQITMSHGNIYISSALDTFIRPGRDLIQLAPRHISTTANSQIEIAAKKNIKVGAEKNLVLASAISGQDGYTVLENRSKEQGDMVIRSNGKLSITSSDDMHIGINDKRTQNKGSAATYGTGSIFIEGEKLRLLSRGQLLVAGAQTGIYSIKNKTGAGIQLKDNIVTTIGSAIYFDTGNIRMGNFQTSYTVKTGTQEDATATLSKGEGTLTVHIRGQLQSRGVMVNGIMQVSNQILAGDYIILKTTSKSIIQGVKESAIKRFKSSLRKIFNSPMQHTALSYQPIQQWYSDTYICDKELSFMDTWQVNLIPTMCWQTLSSANKFRKLKGISVKATGGEQTETYSYPGSLAWKDGQCTMTFIEDKVTYKVEYDKPITEAYTTYTEEGE